ncbi:hypothetical protein ABZS59_04895 [Streptomyces flaveolus]|uniref:hypothetical protein n=1 Tax=Streptomyces flaveolus TaxID=67297 RepID=UPI0033B6DA28
MSHHSERLAVAVSIEPTEGADETVIARLRNDFLEVRGLKRIEITASPSHYTGPGNPKSPASWGVMGIALTAAPVALKQITNILRLWLDRQKARTVTIEIDGEKLELSASSSADQKEALALFLERHMPQNTQGTQGTSTTDS